MHSNVCYSRETERFGRLMKRETCTESAGNRCNLKRGKSCKNIVQLQWYRKGNAMHRDEIKEM